GFALVGQADGGDVAGGRARGVQGLGHGGGDGLPDLFRVVLDPARARVVLVQFPGGAAEAAAGGIVHHGPGAGGALVDGEEDGSHGGYSPWDRRRPWHCDRGRRAWQQAGGGWPGICWTISPAAKNDLYSE